MRAILLIPILALFALVSPQQPQKHLTADQLADDTKAVLDLYQTYVDKLDAVVATGRPIEYTAADTKLLALIHERSADLAGEWQTVFASFGANKKGGETLEGSPKYEKALILSQEMIAISGATQANLSLTLKPHYAEEIARNAVDFMGIAKRMEAVR